MRIFIISSLLFFNYSCLLSQDLVINENKIYFRIAPIYNFKQSIVSITFDDGTISQFTVGVPLLNERKIPATFYIISGRIDKDLKDLMLKAQLNQHEIASHTVDHKNLFTLDNDSVEIELSQSQKLLDNFFYNNECLTIAYPYGGFNNTVTQIAKKYYLAGRSTIGGYNRIDSLYKYRYSLKAMNFNSDVRVQLANNWVDVAIRKRVWLIELIHGFGNDGYKPIYSDIFSNHLNYMKSRESSIWFATVSNVIKYYDESKVTKILCEECNDTLYKIRINDNLDDLIYNQPLSFMLKVPYNWEGIEVSGAEYKSAIFKDHQKFIIFNALPNNDEILIKPGYITTPDKNLDIGIISVMPNPFTNYIDVSFQTIKPLKIELVLKSIYGMTVMIFKENVNGPICQLRLHTDQIPKGYYILELVNINTNQSLSTKLIKY